MPTFVTWISGSPSWSDPFITTSPRSLLNLNLQVPVKKLYLNSEQEDAIRRLYRGNREYRMRFNTTDTSQAAAEDFLHKNGLSQTGQPQNKFETCWLTAWSSSWGSKKGQKKRSLFQWCVSSGSRSYVHRMNKEALRTVHPVITRQRDRPETSADHRTRSNGQGRPATSSQGALHTQTSPGTAAPARSSVSLDTSDTAKNVKLLRLFVRS